MKVLFHNLNDFVAELKADALGGAAIERHILRVAHTWTSSATIPIRRVAVVAAYRVGGTVVQLELECGEVWANSETDSEQAVTLANRITDELAAVARDNGLEVRGGAFVS